MNGTDIEAPSLINLLQCLAFKTKKRGIGESGVGGGLFSEGGLVGGGEEELRDDMLCLKRFVGRLLLIVCVCLLATAMVS